MRPACLLELRNSKTAASDLRTRRGRVRENRRLPSSVRSLDYRSGRKLIGADVGHIQQRCSRSCNLRCRNLGRQNSILLARLRTLLRPRCEVFSTKDRKLKRKPRYAAGAATAHLAAAKCQPRKFFWCLDKCSSP